MTRLAQQTPESIESMVELLEITLRFGGINYPAVDYVIGSLRKHHGSRPERIISVLRERDPEADSVVSIVGRQIAELNDLGFGDSRTVIKLSAILDPETYQNNS